MGCASKNRTNSVSKRSVTASDLSQNLPNSALSPDLDLHSNTKLQQEYGSEVMDPSLGENLLTALKAAVPAGA